MTSRLLPLTLLAVACTPTLLHAQPPPQFPNAPFPSFPTASPNPYANLKDPTIDSTNYDKMYEDIEVMRRILDRQLQPLYPSHTYETFGMVGMGGMDGMRGAPGMPGMQPNTGLGGVGGIGGFDGLRGGMGMAGGTTTVVVPMRSLEGVYLKGQGVVYTVTLSSLQPPKKAAKSEAAKPVSEWDSVRRQVRNEKEEPKKSEASKPPALSDVLLKMLAENGHHFSQLGSNESLIIVLTVHEKERASSTRKSTRGGGRGGSTGPSEQKGNFGGGSDLRGKVSDLVLLGDLHQKQSKYEEAIAEYLKAVELGPDLTEEPTLYRKLAQCYLALGQDEKAQKMLDKVKSLLPTHADPRGRPASPDKPASAEKPTAALPVKLIISAPKKLLDQAKEGKITFEELRRQARVETVGGGSSSR
jgi:tetratricopeptide (TPR) repeat protein